MKHSQTDLDMIRAYNDGYRVVNQVIYNPRGKILKGSVNNRGYRAFKPYKESLNIPVHRLVAYQKYGSKMFDSGIEVRHLDNDKSNNSNSNIGLGTHADNMLDIPEEVRRENAIKASNKIRKFTNREVALIRKDHQVMRSYKDVMSLWGISSKGTLHHILNNKYVTTK